DLMESGKMLGRTINMIKSIDFTQRSRKNLPSNNSKPSKRDIFLVREEGGEVTANEIGTSGMERVGALGDFGFLEEGSSNTGPGLFKTHYSTVPPGAFDVPPGASDVPPGASNVSPGASDAPTVASTVPSDTSVVPASASVVPTGSPNVPAAVTSSGATAGVSSKGKSPMVEEDIPVKARTFKQMEEDRLGEKTAKRLHNAQRKRQQEVLDSAMYYNESESRPQVDH
nr:SGNH hydrolase-type esterase domain-containing protein [Tanacetum cinerariifolium]